MRKVSIHKVVDRLSFRTKLIISLLVISLLMAIFLGVTFYKLSSSIIHDMGIRLSEKTAASAFIMIEEHLNSAYNKSTQFIRLNSLQSILKLKSSQEADTRFKSTLAREVDDIVNYVASEGSVAFNFVNIYCKNGFAYSSKPSVKMPFDNYDNCLLYYIENAYMYEGYNAAVWCNLINTPDTFGQDNYSIVQVRTLYHPYTYAEEGVLIVAISEENLRKQYSVYFPGAFIMHKNGQIISTSDKKMIGTSLFATELYKKLIAQSESTGTISYQDGEKTKIVSYHNMLNKDIYFIIPFEYYTGQELTELNYFGQMSIIVSFLGLVMAFAVAFWLSKGLYRSIKNITTVVKRIQHGEFNARYYSEEQDEIGYLGNSFNDMMDKMNHYYTAQQEAEQTQKNLELRLMQSQINPHLLYNTLNIALWALKEQNTSKVEKLLVSLSGFFKISLSRGNEMIPLKNELALIQNYLEIQRLARGKDFHIVMDVPDELLEEKIFKLTLQPLVENAIIHGFSGYRNDGTIWIKVTGGNDLIIVVEDNGIGIEEEELRQLRDLLVIYPPTGEMHSFGLYNVDRRIKRMFGSEYGIKIESAVGEYTRIYIKIPYDRKGSEEKHV